MKSWVGNSHRYIRVSQGSPLTNRSQPSFSSRFASTSCIQRIERVSCPSRKETLHLTSNPAKQLQHPRVFSSSNLLSLPARKLHFDRTWCYAPLCVLDRRPLSVRPAALPVCVALPLQMPRLPQTASGSTCHDAHIVSNLLRVRECRQKCLKLIMVYPKSAGIAPRGFGVRPDEAARTTSSSSEPLLLLLSSSSPSVASVCLTAVSKPAGKGAEAAGVGEGRSGTAPR